MELERKPPVADKPWTDEEISHTRWLFSASRNRVLPATLRAVIAKLTDSEEIVEEAKAYIAALKSRTELEHEEFMLMLGRVMDRAKDMGLDADFVNPLTSMMKKLASNALEHHK
jgi:hypothetical protein